MRDDVVSEGYTGGGQPENIVANAPKTEDNFFVVPRVVE
jgi:aspartyl-tRNA(Asn)/glutamyl-tRNA(Gln) amidotransferase subunit C